MDCLLQTVEWQRIRKLLTWDFRELLTVWEVLVYSKSGPCTPGSPGGARDGLTHLEMVCSTGQQGVSDQAPGSLLRLLPKASEWRQRFFPMSARLSIRGRRPTKQCGAGVCKHVGAPQSMEPDAAAATFYFSSHEPTFKESPTVRGYTASRESRPSTHTLYLCKKHSLGFKGKAHAMVFIVKKVVQTQVLHRTQAPPVMPINGDLQLPGLQGKRARNLEQG